MFSVVISRVCTPFFIGTSLIVKIVLLGGTVVAVGFMCQQQNVHLDSIALEGLKMTTNMSVLVDTSVLWAVQTLNPAKLDITKMRQGSQPVGYAPVGFTAMTPMAQSSRMGSTFVLKVTTVLTEPGMLKSSSAPLVLLTTELGWMNRRIVCHVLGDMSVTSGDFPDQTGCVVLDITAVKVPIVQLLILETRQISAQRVTTVQKV